MTDHQLRLVVWRDAHAVTEGWTHIEDLDKQDCVVTSVGILLVDAKPGYIVLAQSMIDDEHTVDHVLAIPVGMVISAVTISA